MSTILKALKRLEQGHQDVASRNGSPSPTADTRSILRRSYGWDAIRPLGTRWSWTAIALGGLLIGIVLASINIYRSPYRAVSSEAAQTNPAHRVPAGTLIPDDAPGRPLPSAAPQAATPNASQASMKTSDRPSKRPKPATLQNPPPVQRQAESLKPAVLLPKPEAPATSKASPEVGRQPATATTKPSPSFPRLTHKNLDVQAIVWSMNIEDRMAVINNQIVRQGNTVEGFTVAAIEEDYVVVQEAGKCYMAPFGSR